MWHRNLGCDSLGSSWFFFLFYDFDAIRLSVFCEGLIPSGVQGFVSGMSTSLLFRLLTSAALSHAVLRSQEYDWESDFIQSKRYISCWLYPSCTPILLCFCKLICRTSWWSFTWFLSILSLVWLHYLYPYILGAMIY